MTAAKMVMIQGTRRTQAHLAYCVTLCMTITVACLQRRGAGRSAGHAAGAFGPAYPGPMHSGAAAEGGRQERACEVPVVRRVDLIADVALLGLRLRHDVGDAGQNDRHGGVEDGGVEGAAEEGDLCEVDEEHANGLTDVLPDCVEDLEQVLVEERLEDEAGEDEDHGAGGPLAEHVAVTHDAN